MKSKRYEYILMQDGVIVATVDAPTKKEALDEINHYALIYGQDGPVEIKERK